MKYGSFHSMPLKINYSQKKNQHPVIISIWIQAFRLHYVPTSILPALLGGIVAWSRFHEFNFWYFSMVIIAVTFHHIGLNMIDDVFDYIHAVDRSHGEEKNPYTGGSGVLTTKLIPLNHMITAAVICYLIALVIAIYFTIALGWTILIFVIVGAFSSIFYTMPPIRYGYRGFGELSMFINFGPVISLGAFYVQTNSISLEPIIISFVPGFLMWSMIVINEIPDYDEDRESGKFNLVVRVGRKQGVLLYAAGLIFAYVTMLLCAFFKLTSFGVVFGLLTAPIAYGSFQTLKNNYMDKLKMAPANLATIKVHALTMICLIIGYLADGIISR
jgi:1,4-dihydroxy-2-naphthoate polyprenyltransferase